MPTSKKYQLIKQDLHKILIGAAMAAAGAGVTYLLEWVVKLDFGDWTPIVVATASIVTNIARKVFIITKY